MNDLFDATCVGLAVGAVLAPVMAALLFRAPTFCIIGGVLVASLVFIVWYATHDPEPPRRD